MLFAGGQTYAQQNTDSIRLARERILDSTRKAQQRYNDSLRTARQKIIDSTREAQKRYNDSATAARQRILDSTRKAQKAYNDSVVAERQRITDSTRTAQQRFFDSMRLARQKIQDSIKEERERVSDSLAVIREYRQSDRYKDSVAAVRQARIDSIKYVREKRLDSIRTERKRVTDSIVAVRKAYTDSIKLVQKRRSDSLTAIREYRQSDRYKDSVQVVRQMRLDSIKAVRTAYYDSIKTERQRVNDSIAAKRKAYTDSLTAARKAYTDSLKVVRQARSDSLAKLKEEREKAKEVREKQREEKAKLALELKIKKKREAYNNEDMLKKRWGFPRSVIQNTFTRYNYYFNADQKMDEALDNMQRLRQDNYDSLLALFPFDPNKDSTVLATDMDSIIHKASLGIQIHDPRTKWGDDLYLLLGQAYFYKGDYKNAENAFKYVVSLRDKRKKKKNRNKRSSSKGNESLVQEEKTGVGKMLMHKSVHNEAILWLARAYTQQSKEGDAESILDLVETDPNFSGSLEGRVALEKSFIRLHEKDYRGAMEPLAKVSKDKDLPDWVRIRAAYINGQILQRYEQYTASAESFKQVLDLHPRIEMDFNAKKSLATSLMLAGGEQQEAVALLEKILNDGKYARYYEQVYYLLGKLSLNGGDEEQAVAYLEESINAGKSTDAQKARSYATLGDIYYTQRKYEMSKDAYDSASIYMGNVEQDAQMETALRRSVALGNLTDPLRVINDNDSLLLLASLDDKEQRSIVRKYIRMLEDRRADSIFRAENAGLTAAFNSSSNNVGNNKNNYANWYFSNPALMQKGYNDFKQQWGTRALTDDWRLSSASAFAGMDEQELDGDGEFDANGIPTEEFLLAQIPNDEESRNQAEDDIRKAYIDAANAYVKELEDYPPAVTILDTLDVRYPGHEYSAEALYIRYIIALRQNDFDAAKGYSATLQDKYSETEWAKLVKPTEDGAGLGNTDESVVSYYDKTYSMVLQRQYAQALPRAQEGQRIYDIPVYKNRFQILEAISLASLDSFRTADSVLDVFYTTHTDPNDSLRKWADAVKAYIEKNKVIAVNTGGNALNNGSAADLSSGDGQNSPAGLKPISQSSSGQGTTPAKYTYDAKAEHFVMFTFPAFEQRTKGVQAAIKDFNQFKFGSLKLDTEIKMLNANEGAIVTRSFTNKNQAVIYMNSLRKTKQVFREYQASEYEVVMISAGNFSKLEASGDIKAYLRFFKSKY